MSKTRMGWGLLRGLLRGSWAIKGGHVRNRSNANLKEDLH